MSAGSVGLCMDVAEDVTLKVQAPLFRSFYERHALQVLQMLIAGEKLSFVSFRC